MFFNCLLLLLVIAAVITAFVQKSFMLHEFDKESSLSFKGFLAICVVVRHLLGKCFLIPGMIPLGYYAVILFFFCAGYGLMLQFQMKGNHYLRSFFRDRILKIFTPFCVATILYGMVNNGMLCSLGGGKICKVSILDLLSGHTILPYSWFAITILLFYVAFYFCAKVCKSSNMLLPVLLLCFSIFYIYIVGIRLGWGGYWINAVLAINVGAFYYLFEAKIKRMIGDYPKLSSLLLPLILGFMILALDKGFWIESFMCSICLPLLTVISIYYIGVINNRWIKFLGKYSYEIYLTHGAVLALYLFFENTFVNQCWFTLLSVILIAICSIVLNKLSSRIFKAIAHC